MKGFKIIINDGDPVIAACDDVVSLVISAGYTENAHMDIVGLDSSQYHFKWFGKQLRTGDKIKVKICETDRVSQPSEKYPSDREEMVQKYYELKQQLQEEGKL